jgi:hypothetical protein
MKMKKGQEVWTGSKAQQDAYAKNNPTKSVPAKATKKAPSKARPKK